MHVQAPDRLTKSTAKWAHSKHFDHLGMPNVLQLTEAWHALQNDLTMSVQELFQLGWLQLVQLLDGLLHHEVALLS